MNAEDLGARVERAWRGFRNRTWPQGISESAQHAVRRAGEREVLLHLAMGVKVMCEPGSPEPTKQVLADLMTRALNAAYAEEGTETAERFALEQGARLARQASRVGAAR